MNMGNWKRKIFLKQSRKGRGQSSGKEKKGTCIADYRKKYFAKRSRSYKDREYSDWCIWADKVNS